MIKYFSWCIKYIVMSKINSTYGDCILIHPLCIDLSCYRKFVIVLQMVDAIRPIKDGVSLFGGGEGTRSGKGRLGSSPW
jgi:hypothetical protein